MRRDRRASAAEFRGAPAAAEPEMIFTQTPIPGCVVIDLEPFTDERGFYAQTFSRQEFKRHGINSDVVEGGMSFNPRRGTLRGMHFQRPPHAQAKLVRCTRGGIYDVAIDLRPGSAAFRRWHAVELTAENRRMFFLPEGIAHGYLALQDGTEMTYLLSAIYAPQAADGVRWNDPAFGVKWPMEPTVISQRDRDYPSFDDSMAEGFRA